MPHRVALTCWDSCKHCRSKRVESIKTDDFVVSGALKTFNYLNRHSGEGNFSHCRITTENLTANNSCGRVKNLPRGPKKQGYCMKTPMSWNFARNHPFTLSGKKDMKTQYSWCLDLELPDFTNLVTNKVVVEPSTIYIYIYNPVKQFRTTEPKNKLDK